MLVERAISKISSHHFFGVSTNSQYTDRYKKKWPKSPEENHATIWVYIQPAMFSKQGPEYFPLKQQLLLER